MHRKFSALPDSSVEEAFALLRAVGDWLDSQGRRQRISKTMLADYSLWQSEGANYVVTEHDSIIGVVTVRREVLAEWPDFSVLGRVLMLRGLATHPEHRGSGVGDCAVRAAIKLVGKNEDLYLDCVSEFLPGYYSQFGFESIAQQVRHYPDDDPYDITLMRFRHVPV